MTSLGSTQFTPTATILNLKHNRRNSEIRPPMTQVEYRLFVVLAFDVLDLMQAYY